MKIEAVGDRVRGVTQSGERDFEYSLDAEQARGVFLALGEAIVNASGGRGDPSTPIANRPAMMRVVDAPHVLMTNSTGHTTLVVMPGPLAPIHLSFSDEAAKGIADTLLQIVGTPREIRNLRPQ